MYDLWRSDNCNKCYNKFINTSSKLIPNTKKLIFDKINIYSAKELFNHYDMENWKKYTFKYIFK